MSQDERGCGTCRLWLPTDESDNTKPANEACKSERCHEHQAVQDQFNLTISRLKEYFYRHPLLTSSSSINNYYMQTNLLSRSQTFGSRDFQQILRPDLNSTIMSSVQAMESIQDLNIASQNHDYWQTALGIESQQMYRIRAQQVYNLIRDRWPNKNQLTFTHENMALLSAQLRPFIHTFYGTKPEQFNSAILNYTAWAFFLNEHKHTVNLPRAPAVGDAQIDSKYNMRLLSYTLTTL